MTEKETDELVAQLAADGIEVTREEAKEAVRKVVEIMLLVRKEAPHWPPFDPKAWEDLLLSLAESDHKR